MIASRLGTVSAPDALLGLAAGKLLAAQSAPKAACKICGNVAEPFDLVDFNKSCDRSQYPLGLACIPILYRKCRECDFIFTDFFDGFTPDQWRFYIYNDEYARVDPEYGSARPLQNARQIVSLLLGRKGSTLGLDFGGGNGATTVLLRDRGWTFDCYDPFGYTDMAPGHAGHYNFCSAVQVLEHSPDPVGSVRAMVEKCSSGALILLIATGTHDGFVSPATRLSWWYAGPRNGHVSLFSRKSLRVLAAGQGLSSVQVHNVVLMTRGISYSRAKWMIVRGGLLRRIRTASHLWRGNLAG